MNRFRKFLLVAGVLLLLSGIALFAGTRYLSTRGGAEEVYDRLSEAVPERIGGAVGVYSHPEMPVMALDGQDFCGLLELPGYGIRLPIGAAWNSLNTLRWPCRYSGSVYDGRLIIGGADQPGQLEICKRLDLGDVILVTDLTGMEFRYEVVRVDRAKQADSQTLTRGDFDLTLYIRNSYGSEYILVRCNQS